MTTTTNHITGAVKIGEVWVNITVDHADRVIGCYLEDGSIATVADLREIAETRGTKALAAILADSIAIHG